MNLVKLTSTIILMSVEQDFNPNALRLSSNSDADPASFFNNVVGDVEGLDGELHETSKRRAQRAAGLMGIVGARNAQFFELPDQKSETSV